VRVGIDGLLLWGEYSGVERTIARLAATLPRVDLGNDYVLYVPADTPGVGETPPNLRLRRAPFAGRHKAMRILWQQACLPRTLAEDEVDVLFAPGYTLPLRWRGPSVLLVHDVIALTHPELARPANVWHYGLMLPRSARRAGRIVVPTTQVRDEVVRVCGVPAERITVVPHGIEPHFRPVEDAAVLARVRTRYSLPERFVLSVGNLEPKKNLPCLLEAFALLRREGLPHALVLAGKEGWGVSELGATIERLGIADAVCFPGFVADDDLPALYSLAELFVFPSLVEGFGLPPLEAMACGTPAIVADVPPFAETVGDGAVRVDPHRPEAIAAGVRRVLEDDALRQRLREAGLRRAAGYTWEAAAECIVRLCREAVRKAS
jgi:glycosyltransferase involved in cell wall biosynthesis